MRKYFTQSMTILGTVTQKEPRAGIFTIRCRSEDEYLIHVSPVTHFQVLRHLDGSDRDRFPIPGNVYSSSQATLIQRYIFLDRLIYVQGIWQEHQGQSYFEATTIVLLQDIQGNFLFETSNWWLNQITCLADSWLEKQLSQQRIASNSMNVIGLQNDETLQSGAWVSRLIYGLSSSYLLTGKDRYRLAAKNWVAYQREYFQTISYDRKYCFWAFGKRGQDLIMVSEVSEDYPGIPLYEQICVLAGLSQYYRISQDRVVFEDIHRTIATFNELFKDTSSNGGYFSHIDYATLSCDRNHLGQNKLRKNWHSNGEHIPAYLIDLILALDSMPTPANEAIGELYHTCRENLDAIVDLLVERFPDGDAEVPYINERFYYNWIPDRSWAWQQNRAIIGNNFRMAWTLCRVATYYLTVVSQSERAGKAEIAQQFSQKANGLMNLAESLAMKMIPKGLDLLRGGVFNLVEREPQNGQPVEFAGSYTKDSWQQEQAILAYLMLYGATGKSLYLDIARDLSAFWHLFCVSHNPTGIFFRVEADGKHTGNLGSLDIGSPARYPLWEINYLGHIYTQLYSKVKDQGYFCLYFKPDLDLTLDSINVLPDFVRPGTVEIKAYSINGIRKIPENPQNFQIDLSQERSGCELIVEFQTVNCEVRINEAKAFGKKNWDCC
ncbi:hypothetical protein [Floridanema aerugineum]|uniref:N-acyl-D-glucosamine 2-epimerase n=1 Tax=Floridaenema aerugineum BLCC-F46 TaxID=3153654 RepID=A0ABV4X9D6_9CYAN